MGTIFNLCPFRTLSHQIWIPIHSPPRFRCKFRSFPLHVHWQCFARANSARLGNISRAASIASSSGVTGVVSFISQTGTEGSSWQAVQLAFLCVVVGGNGNVQQAGRQDGRRRSFVVCDKTPCSWERTRRVQRLCRDVWGAVVPHCCAEILIINPSGKGEVSIDLNVVVEIRHF